MSQSAPNSLALHEIILSIADSLNDAQQQLRSMPPYDEYGRPNTLYQLPYLDFNLEVISQFESATQTDGAIIPGTPTPPRYEGRENLPLATTPLRAIRFTPFRSTETTGKNLGSITSTISGRFVAVMPNEGLSQIFLNCTTELIGVDSDYADYTLTVQALKANNEPVTGQRIEVNFDELTSLGFNAQESVSSPVFSNAKDGYTDVNGKFAVSVKLDLTAYNNNKTFVFVANSGTQFSSISISKS